MKLSNLYTVIILLLLSSCSRCNKKPAPIVSEADVIVAITQPEIDSLKREVAVRDTIISQLYTQLNHSSLEAYAAKKSAQKSADQLKAALVRKDTASIISSAESNDDEFHKYVKATDYKDSVQGALIASQDSTISDQIMQINAEEKKSQMLNATLKKAEVEKSDLRAAAEKYLKKLHRSHFWNKVFGGTAVIGILYFLLTVLIP